MIRPGKKLLKSCILFLFAILLLWNPIKYLSWSVKLALAMQQLASGAKEQKLSVIEAKIHRQDGDHSYEALYYRPGNKPATSAVVLAAGLSEQGCYHPRLMALARVLANNGLLVVTPDIKEFREFRIAAEPIDQLVFWHRQTNTLEGGEGVRKVGLAGISYSGTLALIAATRPEIRQNVSFVLAIGPYYNLIRCTREWFAAGAVNEGNGYYPTRFYAKWLIMRAALDMIAATEDRPFIDQVLNNLLLSKKVPPPGSNLTPEGLRWYNLAVMKPGQTDAELSFWIERHLTSTIYPKLDPQSMLTNLRSRLFLIHGAYDDLIPPKESMELHRHYLRSYLLISPFLTHTHPTEKPLTFRQKLATGWDTLRFCYQLARAIQ
jgi:pimeloyl-ACP methyl ester carboxylesterase